MSKETGNSTNIVRSRSRNTDSKRMMFVWYSAGYVSTGIALACGLTNWQAVLVMIPVIVAVAINGITEDRNND